MVDVIPVVGVAAMVIGLCVAGVTSSDVGVSVGVAGVTPSDVGVSVGVVGVTVRVAVCAHCVIPPTAMAHTTS